MARTEPATPALDDRFKDAVHTFATEIFEMAFQHTLGMVRGAMRQMGERVIKPGAEGAVQVKIGAITAPALAPAKPAKIVVHCPVPGCTNPGLRTLMNFCVEHNRSLPKDKKTKLREAQRKAQLEQAKSAKSSDAKPATRAVEAKPVAKAAPAPRPTGKKGAAKKSKKPAAAAKPVAKKGRKPAARPVSRSAAAVNEAKRIAGTKPVACPVPGCKRPGVRRFSNFCTDHHASLPVAEQKALRDAQRKVQAQEAQAGAAS